MANGFADLNGARVKVTNDALDVNMSTSAGGAGSSSSAPLYAVIKGSANVAVGQVTTSGTAGTLVIARPTRTSVAIRNHDTSISVYIGPATVTTSNGYLIKAGEERIVTWVGLIQVIAASGTPVVGYWDEYES